LAELGLTKNESAAYQQLPHPDVTDNVILDAVAAAGAEGREITKRDTHEAAKAEELTRAVREARESEQRRRMVELRRQGLSFAKIGVEVGLSDEAVRQFILALPSDPKDDAKFGQSGQMSNRDHA
jgi:DNA-binding NarL/FixJ family response regulator